MRTFARWTLLRKFTILSLVCFALLGVGLSQLLANQIRQRSMSNAVASAQLLSDLVVRTELQPADLNQRVAPQRARRLNLAVGQARQRGRIVRLKVWNRSGRIVYSDEQSEIGKRFRVEEDLEGAFGGKPFVDISTGKDAEQRAEKRFGRLIEAYVPLRLGADTRPAGAMEIYLPYAPVAQATSHDVRNMYLFVVGGLALLYLMLYRIVSTASRKLRRQASESRRQAIHDPLTGLRNRRALYEELDALLTPGADGEDGVALLLADLDGFKELNDTLGHQAGDAVLAQLGPRMRVALQDVELLARVGGDEFAVVVRGYGRKRAEGIAERFRNALSDPFSVDGIDLAVQASIGIAYFPDDGADANELLQRADVAMYEAKASQAGWLAYDADRHDRSTVRVELAGELRRAISDGELVVHYQPKAELHSGEVTSVEALVRWQHPKHGLLPPVEFIPVAERTGLIRPLTLYVLDRAVRQLREWEELGLDLRVSVNLAMENVLDTRLPDDVAALLAKTQLPPSRLVLEITENVVMADPGRTIDVLGRLRALGVGLSLDDFGTGQSSLAYLRQLELDELKIDRSFVTDMDAQNAAIVRSTIELAHGVGLRVVAEGVEDANTLFELKEMGADVAQGFYLSKPVPPMEIVALLMHATRRERPRQDAVGGESPGVSA
jgi:diguanylate cyclase (GGDEF)-like protein